MLTQSIKDQASGTADSAIAPRGLTQSPLLYVFYEACNLEQQRDVYERVLGLPVIENQFHPPHEVHGLVKYDAGTIVISLNLCGQSRFENDGSDGMVAAYTVPNCGEVFERLMEGTHPVSGQATMFFSDLHGHHYELSEADVRGALTAENKTPILRQLRLTVKDLTESIDFYEGILGLTLKSRADRSALFSAGPVDLAIEQIESPDKVGQLRGGTYLIVFYTRDARAMYASLTARGLSFKSPRVSYSDIGGTARFQDPTGHTFCIYEPSEESLGWGSGPKIKELMARAEAAESLAQT